MIDLLALMILIFVAIQFYIDIRKSGLRDIIFSPFWIVTVFWIIGYPLRAYLISRNLIEIQAENFQDQIELKYLVTALALSAIYWLIMRLGYASAKRSCESNTGMSFVGAVIDKGSLLRARSFSILSIVLALIFIEDYFFIGDTYSGFSGNNQNEARTGNGLKFLMSVFYVYSAYCLLGFFAIKKRVPEVIDGIIILAFIAVGLFLGNALTSRRVIIEMPILIFIFSAYLYQGLRRYWPLFGFLIIFVIMPITQVARYHDFTEGDWSDLISAVAYYMSDFEFYLNSVSSTTEGVDHFAQLLLKMDWLQMATGVDYGESWLYSFGLSNVPRVFWPDKPEIYGLIAQQYFLYPNMYYYGAATTTFPPSFIVDFSYGFGLIFAALLLYIFGRSLYVIEYFLTLRSYRGLMIIVGLYVVINSFNLFRGGTSFLSSALVFFIPLGATFGFRNLFLEIWQCASIVFGISLGNRKTNVPENIASRW
jgi:hypothetical protein